MQTIWVDDIVVKLTGAVDDGGDPAFEGFAVYQKQTFTWTAMPTPTGYVVDIHGAARRLGQVYGSTLNLGLEVASAVKRLI